MTDRYKIDGHKLMYHVGRVSDWLEGKDVYPIYAEISPSGTCNHRCSYCALDFMKYQERFLDAELLKERLGELGGLGLKSVMYAGEGEPLLHKDIADIIRTTKEAGIDAALTTNGVLLNRGLAEEVLPHTTWIKVSVNGATRKTYAKIHRTRPEDYDTMVGNLSYAADLRRRTGAGCALGMQMLLLPDNFEEAEPLARQAKEMGMDYLVIKPYSQHPSSKTRKYSEVRYEEYLHLKERLDRHNGDGFSVVFRINAMKKWDEKERGYSECLALPFWTYIDAGGGVWGCSIYLEREEFYYGNIYENTFKEIWEGERRRRSLEMVRTMDAGNCRVGCRMDEINRYLHALKDPPEHSNFI